MSTCRFPEVLQLNDTLCLLADKDTYTRGQYSALWGKSPHGTGSCIPYPPLLVLETHSVVNARIFYSMNRAFFAEDVLSSLESSRSGKCC